MRILLIVVVTILASCSGSPKRSNLKEFPESFRLILDAHGGLSKWQTAQTLSFSVDAERYAVDLKSRKTKVEVPGKAFGFDGEEIWVVPDSARDGNERFMYNLLFYFFGMPFVFADPGVRFQSIDNKILDGKSYQALKISYEDTIGDSPKDEYIILSDPETHQMQWLMYKATFGAAEAAEEFNLIRYKDWSYSNNLLVPQVIQWTSFEADSTGDVQGEVRFEAVEFSESPMEPGFWERPTATQKDPM